MSRIGKIARLPKAVREELNRRLEDGEQQSRLVDWLNGREEVHAVLKAEFDGRPVNEPNLTAWAQGGWEDWRRQQEAAAAAGRVVEESTELSVMAKDRRLADRAADMAALAMAEQLMAIRRMEDGEEKRRAVLKIVRGLVRLRKSERDCERGLREAAQAARAAEVHEDWAERMRPRGRRKTGDRGRVTGDRGRRTDLNEHDYDYEHEHTDVRARMEEVLADMSDEEIAEILRKGGYMSPASAKPMAGRPASAKPSAFAKPTADRTEGRPEDGKPRPNAAFVEAWAPDGTWWSEEDEALEGGEFEDEEYPPTPGLLPPSLVRSYGETRPRGSLCSEARNVSNLPPEGGTQPSPGGYGGQATNTGTEESESSGHKSPPTVQTNPPGAAGSGRSTGSGQGDPAYGGQARPTTGPADGGLREA